MKTELLDFIRGKITSIEESVRAREDMEKVWRGGSDATWAAVAKMNGGKPTTKAERIATADAQLRILIKLRHELEMFKGVLEALLAVKV